MKPMAVTTAAALFILVVHLMPSHFGSDLEASSPRCNIMSQANAPASNFAISAIAIIFYLYFFTLCMYTRKKNIANAADATASRNHMSVGTYHSCAPRIIAAHPSTYVDNPHSTASAVAALHKFQVIFILFYLLFLKLMRTTKAVARLSNL